MNGQLPTKPIAKARWNAMAFMVATGARSEQQIADELGVSKPQVQRTVNSPLFQALVEQIQKDIQEKYVSDMYDYVQREAMPSLRTVSDIRDDTDVPPGIRLDSAKFIVNKAMPTVNVQENHNVHSFDPKTAQLMEMAIAEEEGRKPTIINHEAYTQIVEAQESGIQPDPTEEE